MKILKHLSSRNCPNCPTLLLIQDRAKEREEGYVKSGVVGNASQRNIKIILDTHITHVIEA